MAVPKADVSKDRQQSQLVSDPGQITFLVAA